MAKLEFIDNSPEPKLAYPGYHCAICNKDVGWDHAHGDTTYVVNTIASSSVMTTDGTYCTYVSTNNDWRR